MPDGIAGSPGSDQRDYTDDAMIDIARVDTALRQRYSAENQEYIDKSVRSTHKIP
jgi:hypothetical protein